MSRSPESDEVIAALRIELERERARADAATALLAERDAELARIKQGELRAFFDLPAVGVAQADESTRRFVRVNRRFCDITGYDAAELCAQTFQDITHPDDRARDVETFVRGATSEAGSWVSEKRYLRKDGTITWVLVSGAVIRDPSGKPAGTLAIIQTIDELKRVEQALRESHAHLEDVLRSITEAYFALDVNFRFIEVNRAAEETLFRKPAKELLGKEFWQVFPQGVGTDFWKNYREAMADGQERHFEAKSRIVERWFETHVYPRKSRLEVYFRDVTERKKAEEALRESVDRLREADRRKDEFLAMLGHELRNPLAPIMMAIELLRIRLPANADIERLRDVIERQVRHMTRLVDDLLEVSRITLGKIRLDRQIVDARTIAQRAIETSKPLVESRKHALTVDLPRAPISVDVDPVRLAQVIGNLLNNAAKYTEEGGAIHVSVSREEGFAVVRVTDNGIGIAPEQLERVFDLFSQNDSSLDRAAGGLGIGLTLARRLIEMHGGTLDVSSAGPGRGSTFTARIPALPLQQEPLEGCAQTQRAARGDRLSALVVDDNEDAADMLAALLESLGNDVRVAHDGASAIALVRAEKPDLVLLDIGLPQMDGLEVARRLRESEDGCPLLVAVTGYGQDDDRRRSLDAGFDHHLVKPIDLGAIEALLADMRRQRAAAAAG